MKNTMKRKTSKSKVKVLKPKVTGWDVGTMRFHNTITTSTELMKFIQEVSLYADMPTNVSFLIELIDENFKKILPENDRDKKSVGFVKGKVNVILINTDYKKTLDKSI